MAKQLNEKVTPNFHKIKADVLISLSLALPDYLSYSAELPRVESVFQDEAVFARVLHHAKLYKQEKRLLLLRDILQYELMSSHEREGFASFFFFF